jgi:lysophospholipase L1-like esterase
MEKNRLVARGLGAVVAVVVALLAAACSTGARVAPEVPPPVTVAVGDGRPVVAFIGDSWTWGVGSSDGHGYAVLVAERLGWDYRLLGVRGSGYSVGGSADNTYADRVDAALATQPDVVVVQGSLNERRSSPARLAAAAGATLSRLAETAPPDVAVVVVGASYNPGTPDATIDWINAAISAAADAADLRFVDPAAENWTDPSDPALWSDPIHPDDDGHGLIADHLAPLLDEIVVTGPVEG